MVKKIPKLAIVGRPNVGKSALFNRLCKKRISIVDEAEGITRDRLYAKADFFGRPFDIIDTGGMDLKSDVPFNEAIFRQAEIAIEEADVLVLVVDGQVGRTQLDEQVARILKRVDKPVTLAVNKVDNLDQLDRIDDFYSLGLSHMEGVSAVHGLRVAELLETAFRDTIWEEEEEIDDGALKVAIVGRPNVGKSTLVNHLLDEDRCLVSPIAGTTRDSIDIDIEVEGKQYRLIDTAGIRRKGAEHEVVDKFAAIRTERALERADLCLLIIDANEGLTTQEKRIAREIESLGKGCILLFNKWDMVKGFRMEHCLKSIRDEVPFLGHCPALFISAKTGRNLEKIYTHIDEVASQARHRIGTGELNRFLEKAMQSYHPPMLRGKRLRVYYIAQIGIEPPHFALFVNRPDLMVDSYKKYLINTFRKTFAFTGVPITFSLRGKKQMATASNS
ncbi:MAG: ribosome biogenesis GTPase Der [Simkaniaceae bacterium]|nr:ribosome biogenesis GTPase Der [Candidatus Sacchlamyda saccharinae]